MSAVTAPETTRAAQFWDRIAPRYARRAVADTASWEQSLASTRSHLSPGDHVLEIGAGTGTTACRLAPHVARYTASDFADGMAEIARGRAAEAGLGNLGIETAAPGDPAIAGPYDAVLAFNLLHLLPDLRRDLAAVHAALRPGGLFIAKTSLLADEAWPLRPAMRLAIGAMRVVGKAPFVAFLTGAALNDAVREAGFEIVEEARHPEGSARQFLVARRPVSG